MSQNAQSKPVVFPLGQRYRVVIRKQGSKWSLERFNDNHRWQKVTSGTIADDDDQFVALKGNLVVDNPDALTALKLSLAVQRAQANLPAA